MRTNIFQNKKKYIISLLKQTKIVQMLNVWSEGFSKNNKFYFSAILHFCVPSKNVGDAPGIHVIDTI